MARSLNKVTLIGNLTKDPELRYTPSGVGVCNFSVATNREWTDSQGQKKDEVTYHKIIAWQKLAEICSQYLHKGSKVYLEGRLANRTWDDKSGVKHYETEIVMDEMLMLDTKKAAVTNNTAPVAPATPAVAPPPEPETVPDTATKPKENVNPDDIPF